MEITRTELKEIIKEAINEAWTNKPGTIAKVFQEHKDELDKAFKESGLNGLHAEVMRLLSFDELKNNPAVPVAKNRFMNAKKKGPTAYYSLVTTYMLGDKVI